MKPTKEQIRKEFEKNKSLKEITENEWSGIGGGEGELWLKCSDGNLYYKLTIPKPEVPLVVGGIYERNGEKYILNICNKFYILFNLSGFNLFTSNYSKEEMIKELQQFKYLGKAEKMLK